MEILLHSWKTKSGPFLVFEKKTTTIFREKVSWRDFFK